MLKLFPGKNKGKSEDDDGIVVLSEPGPLECGGTSATRDTRAPKTIRSEEMVLFSVNSAFGPCGAFDQDEDGGWPLRFFSAFAAPAGQGYFLFLSTVRSEKEQKNWAFVKDSPFPALTRLVRELDLAKDNGYHSRTHGLPQNFGGEVDVRYESGERISFSDNQSPILSAKGGREIVRLFQSAMAGEQADLPDLAGLCGIRFEEKRPNGGFTEAILTLLPDGTGVNAKRCRYDDPKLYESTKPVDKETVDAIKKTMEETGVLAWAGLPDRDYCSENKTLTFTFKDGKAVAVGAGALSRSPCAPDSFKSNWSFPPKRRA